MFICVFWSWVSLAVFKIKDGFLSPYPMIWGTIKSFHFQNILWFFLSLFFFTSVYIASLLLHPVLFVGVLIITVIAIFMILSGDINIFTTLKFLLPVFMLPVSTLCHRMWKGKWAFSIRTKAVSLTWPSPCLALAVVLVLGFWTSLSVFRFPGNPSKVIIVKHGTGSVH